MWSRKNFPGQQTWSAWGEKDPTNGGGFGGRSKGEDKIKLMMVRLWIHTFITNRGCWKLSLTTVNHQNLVEGWNLAMQKIHSAHFGWLHLKQHIRGYSELFE